MLQGISEAGLEVKFCRVAAGVSLDEDGVITGYASVFGRPDQGGDVVQKGAYKASLERLKAKGGAVKMLWQHDPAQPIGIWQEMFEDETGLFVKGRLLREVQKGAEAMSLIAAGAIDGLSIGYRTLRAEKNAKGQRLLFELELWEVSLVTFPMLSEARVQGKAETPGDSELAVELAAAFTGARNTLAGFGRR
jgi:Escherichia/Staphylococcus phage prohead protease